MAWEPSRKVESITEAVIFMGINQTYDAMINCGAVTVAIMAVVVDYIFGYIEHRLVSKGLQP